MVHRAVADMLGNGGPVDHIGGGLEFIDDAIKMAEERHMKFEIQRKSLFTTKSFEGRVIYKCKRIECK